MYYGYSREKGNDYIVDLLDNIYIQKRITAKNIDNPLKIKEIQAYILSLKTSVGHWYYLFNPTQANYDRDIKFLLDKLYRLNYEAFKPLLMVVFSRDDKYDVNEICELLDLMEKYIFLAFKVSQRRSNTGNSEFYGYAKRYYYEKNISIQEIIGEWNVERNEDYDINWWIRSYVDINQFYNYLEDKFKNREGYYSWNGLSYFF